MKRIVVILQTAVILILWYVVYGTGFFEKFQLGAGGIAGKWIVYVLPLFFVGVILGADGFIENIRSRAHVYKLNVVLLFFYMFALVVVAVMVSGRFMHIDALSGEMAAEAYRKLNFSRIFGMGAYSAVALCAGHMLVSLAGKDKENIVINYAAVIVLWFVFYDILYPMTEKMAAVGENLSLSLLVMFLPMFLTGIILRIRHIGRNRQKKVTDKAVLTALIVIGAAALVVPVCFMLFDFGINIFINQNIMTHIFNFLNSSYLYLMLWLCAGHMLMLCRKSSSDTAEN